MSAPASGCGGSGGCGCGARAAAAAATPPASINGIALHDPGSRPDEDSLRERSWGELLRQHAVNRGLLQRHGGLQAPDLSPADRGTIEAMLDAEVQVPAPTEQECRRFYETRKAHFVLDRKVEARHILFAVTEGVDVARLAARAEQALLELSRKDVAPERFGQLARELSNCPSGADGGQLGWLGPEDCADELAAELFPVTQPPPGPGLRPRLVHSRYGLHIIEVLARTEGRQLSFEEAHDRIAAQLEQQSRARALHQFMQLLAGSALVEGVALAGAETPLVQ